MIKEEFESLLELDWNEEDEKLIKDIQKNIIFYKNFLPKQIKEHVIKALQLSKRLKEENNRMSKNNGFKCSLD
jgi:hypothetical protein